MKYEATGSRRYACGERSVERREKKKEEARERERDGRTWPCKQRGYAAAASLFSPLLCSPLLSSALLSSAHRSARSLAFSSLLFVVRRSPSLSCRNLRPLSVPLFIYPVRRFPLFPFPRVHVRACTRVAASSSIGGRATQRAGYFSGWDI